MSPNHRKKEQAMRKIRQEAEKKTFFQTPSFLEMFLVELQYISPSFWVLQGIFVAVLVLLLEMAGGSGSFASQLQGNAGSLGNLVNMVNLENQAILENPGNLENVGNLGNMDNLGNLESLAACLQWTSVIAAWMGVAGCSQLSRHFAKGMAELEQSCYFNLAQMWTIRMVLTGIVDLMILTLCSGRIAERTDMPFGAVCLYVLVPFVLANACCMLFFTALRGGRSRYVQLVLAFVTGILSAVPSVTPSEAYAQSSLWAWAAALAGGVGFYLWQLRSMYGKIKRGDVVCWN